MKAAIYNPYWDTLGGGERYSASVVKVLLDAGYDVDIEWVSNSIFSDLKKRFNLKLDDARVVKSVNRGDGYDACFWVSDGSVPTLRARNNILHFQFPFKNINGKTLINRMKFIRIKHVVCNSEFTKSFIDSEFGIKSEVVYPPIDTKLFKPKRKENLIIYVGRFSELTQSKHQDILIKTFKKFYDRGNGSWRLVLAGGSEIGAKKNVKKLKKLAVGYPILILESPSYKNVIELFGKAKLFWSASGYKVDEQKNPIKVEHFGISVVEAMSAKAIPIITNKGGHKEIIEHGLNGYLWDTKSDLISISQSLIDNPKRLRVIANKTQKDSNIYSYEKFEEKILALLTGSS